MLLCAGISVPVGGFRAAAEALLDLDLGHEMVRFGGVFTGVTLVNLNEKGVDEAKSSVRLATVELRRGANSKPGAARGAFQGDGSMAGRRWSFRCRHF